MHRCSLALIGVLVATGCTFPKPLSTRDHDAELTVARHARDVFPRAHEVEVLRPRFGIPAVLEDTRTLSISVLEQGPMVALSAVLVRADVSDAAACGSAPAGDCIPLTLTETSVDPLDAGYTTHTFAATMSGEPHARAYDLIVGSARARRAVYVRPAAPDHALSVVQLSDLHLGQSETTASRLDAIVADVNALRPDVVVVTGDMVEQGHSAFLESAAADALSKLDAIVLTVPGNHDYGHFPKVTRPDEPDRGIYNFARAFHPYRFSSTTIGGWRFVGFDSGPSVFSPRVLVRGISPDTVARLDAELQRAAAAHEGVVLFSHAPLRAALGDHGSDLGSTRIGGMVTGASELEGAISRANRTGLRVVHLGGHTHWSDAFVARDGDAISWRVPFERLPCATTTSSPLLLVNAPSATRISFHTVKRGLAYGYVALTLLPRETTFQFHLFDGDGYPRACR